MFVGEKIALLPIKLSQMSRWDFSGLLENPVTVEKPLSGVIQPAKISKRVYDSLSANVRSIWISFTCRSCKQLGYVRDSCEFHLPPVTSSYMGVLGVFFRPPSVFWERWLQCVCSENQKDLISSATIPQKHYVPSKDTINNKLLPGYFKDPLAIMQFYSA